MYLMAIPPHLKTMPKTINFYCSAKCSNRSIGFHIPQKNGFCVRHTISHQLSQISFMHPAFPNYILALGFATLKIIKITSLSQYPAPPNTFSDRIWTTSTHQSPQITFNNHYSTTKKNRKGRNLKLFKVNIIDNIRIPAFQQLLWMVTLYPKQIPINCNDVPFHQYLYHIYHIHSHTHNIYKYICDI